MDSNYFIAVSPFFYLIIKLGERDKMPQEERETNVKDGKIMIGKDKIVCFACGEIIDADTKICPYCDTELK